MHSSPERSPHALGSLTIQPSSMCTHNNARGLVSVVTHNNAVHRGRDGASVLPHRARRGAGVKHQFGNEGEVGPVTAMVYEQLTGIQQEKLDDPYGWVVPV